MAKLLHALTRMTEQFAKLSPNGLQYTTDGDIGPRILRPSKTSLLNLSEAYASQSETGDEIRLFQIQK